jgi:uncharacterized metal-binding protein YceD (DUF177 family)
VDYLKNFVIPFVGLSSGEHHFDYHIDDKFFESFEFSEIKQANVSVDVTLEKRERMMVLTFKMLGSLNVTCSRCLDEFDFPVDLQETLYVKFGPEYIEEDDDVIIIPESESHFDISPFIYDYLNLIVPYRVVHPVDENGQSACDPDVIKRIEALTGNKMPDTRWDKLKDINLE